MNMHAMFRSELRPDQPPELGDPRVRRTRRAIAIAAIAAVAAIALFLIFGRDPAPEAAAPSAPPVTVIVPGRTAVATVISARSEEHTSELQSLMRISYAVFCFKQKKK